MDQEALAYSFLRSALDKFNTVYRENRPHVYAGIDFEGIRDEIAVGKDAALPILEALFTEFKTNAEKAGARVHHAADVQQANELIAQIARESGCRKIVKSKSMTAEETFLNHHLEKEGLVVTETDLGSGSFNSGKRARPTWLCRRSTCRATRWGGLFEEVARRELDSENIDKLVKVAREQLRPTFLEADMGISGANFAIDLPNLVKKTYRALLEADGKKPVKNHCLARVMRNRKLFHFILRKAALAQKPFIRGAPMIRHLPHFFEKAHGFRSLPAIARVPLRDRWKTLKTRVERPALNIAFLVGAQLILSTPNRARRWWICWVTTT